MIKRGFRAQAGEILPVYHSEGCYLLFGLGKNPSFADLLKCFRQLSQKHGHYFEGSTAISWLHGNTPSDVVSWSEAAVNGLIQGTYRIGRFKSEEDPGHPVRNEKMELVIGAPAQRAQGDRLGRSARAN